MEVKPKILVTGSSGYLGRYLIKYAPAQGTSIIAQYRAKMPNDYGRDVQFLKLDFAEQDWSALEAFSPDVVIHTAAMASIDECEVKPEISNYINFEVTRRLVDFTASKNARFIFISSDVVFDGKKGNYSEKDKPIPQNVYARSKTEAEKYVLENHNNAVVVRPALFYGLALNGRPSFTETIMRNLYAGKQVFLFADQFRTPVAVNDLAAALWELIELDYTGILHLGGPQKVSRMEMGEMLCGLFKLDKSLLIPVKSDKAGLIAPRPLDCSLDTTLSQQLLQTRFAGCESGFSISYR